MPVESSPERPVRDTSYAATGIKGFSRRGNTFYGYVPGRGRVKLQAKTQRAARAEWDSLRDKAARGEQVIVPSKLTFEQVADEWWACPNEKVRPRYRNERDVRRIIDRHLLPAWRSRRIGSFAVDDLFELDAKWQERGLSESARANNFKPARRIFDYAVMKRYISVSQNPFAQAPRGSLPSCNGKRSHHEWTTEDVERAIRTARDFDVRKTARRRYADQFELMMRCGLRIGEASGLRFSDIDRESNVLHVRGQWTKHGEYVSHTKTKASQRRVPVTSDQIAALDFRQSFYGLSDDDFIFSECPGGNPPSHSNFRRRCWNKVIEKTGLKLEEGVKITPHDARHACASQLADLDLDSDDVAALLGHSSAKITEDLYVRASRLNACT